MANGCGMQQTMLTGLGGKQAKPALFYDGACRLCAGEISRAAQKAKGSIQFINVHTLDIPQEEKARLLKSLHLWLPSGQVLRGLEANLALWRFAGGHPLASILGFVLIRPFARLAYSSWAQLRYKALYGGSHCNRCALAANDKGEYLGK